MKRLIILMISLTMLTGCVSSFDEVTPSVVTEFFTVKPDVPAELLEAQKAPNANTLKNVKICEGEKELRAYGTELLQANYTNTQKIRALEELLK